MALVLVLAPVAAASALTCNVLVRAVRPALQRYALAKPTARSSHSVPTPQGAGAVVVGTTVLFALVAVTIGSGAAPAELRSFAGLALGAGMLVTVGLLDDLRGLSAGGRLAVQATAVLIVVAAIPETVRLVPLLPIMIERAALLVGTVWFINLYNFMDGIDWMTVAQTVPVAVAISIVGLLGLVPHTETIVAATLAGATAGFAPFNRPVASMFLGDAGSLPMGLIVAWLLMMLAASGYFAAALLLPLYYLADSGLTLASRTARGERVWEAHRGHFYQLATTRGMSVAAVVGRVLAVNVLLAALALVTILVRSDAVDVVALTAGLAIVAWLLVTLRRAGR